MTDLRYPIGEFAYEGRPTPELRQELLHHIEQAPGRLRAAVKGLSEQQLDTPYRPEGWTVRQVAHHVPDSHLNAYVRFKLALTEEEPTIKPYAEDRWARLADTEDTPVEVSLALLDSLHDRWVRLMRSFEPDDAWHGRHHVAHITSLRERNGW
jgi:DinB superfamily